MSDIIKPIFIIGTGRCGSTVFHRTLARHPQIAWLSGFCNRLPGCVFINRSLMYLQDYPILNRIVKKYFPPTETTLYWEYLAPGFSTTFRDLRADDVFVGVKQRVHSELKRHLAGKRCRQLHKMTGWPKVEYILNLFPDARFIHLYRDGRAVANSLLQQKWWQGWKGPDHWRWGRLPEHYQKEWEQGNQSFLLLAAIQWKVLMDAYEKVKVQVRPDYYMEVRYEDFISNVRGTMEHVIDFCELSNKQYFNQANDFSHLFNANDKWQRNLTRQQRALLEQSLHKHLQFYGY